MGGHVAAGTGVGRAAALALMKAGYSVALAGRRIGVGRLGAATGRCGAVTAMVAHEFRHTPQRAYIKQLLAAPGHILPVLRTAWNLSSVEIGVLGARQAVQGGITAGELVAFYGYAAFLVLPRTYDPATHTYGNLYNNLLDYVISAALIFYILTIAGIFRLRKTRPDAERPYKAFGYPIVPALYIAGAAVILFVLFVYQTATTWPGLMIVLTGVPIYFLWRKSQLA